jgi:hypothetical protein
MNVVQRAISTDLRYRGDENVSKNIEMARWKTLTPEEKTGPDENKNEARERAWRFLPSLFPPSVSTTTIALSVPGAQYRKVRW